MDLTRPGNYPRSGRETLGGALFLPRSIDKMRAYIGGTVGEYLATSGFSLRVYALFGVTVEQFREAVASNSTDEDVLQWLHEHGQRPTEQELEAHNTWFRNATPQDEVAWQRFRDFLAAIGQAHRTDVTLQLDRLDLDEEREVPRRE